MYLIARPFKQAKLLIDGLAQEDINATYLPIIDLSYHDEVIKQLNTNLKKFDSVFLTSPTAIDIFMNSVDDISRLCIILSGDSYSARIKSKYSSVEVHYPNGVSGVSNLIQQNILNGITNLAIIGGNRINHNLQTYLIKHEINYSFFACYFRKNIGLQNIKELENLFSSKSLSGIVITSQEIASYILECANISSVIQSIFYNINIISLHPQITTYLQKKGLTNINQTDNARTQAIVKLIKDLENVRR